MKKITALTLLIFSIFFSPVITVKAEEANYSRILSKDVVLYMDEALSSPWFTLPYSYYVKVLSVGGISAKVEYKGESPLKPSVKGYLPITALNIVETPPSAPYPASSFTVNQTCLMYKDSNFAYAETVTENSVIEYYGELKRPGGENFIYGYVTLTTGDKYIGYISQNALVNFALPTLPVEIPKPETSESESVSSTEKEEVKTDNSLGENLQIIIIVAISVVAISIVYLLFRPTSDRAKDEVVSKNSFDDD
ncbi:MAG: hypothetical protein IJ800_05140 [Clostridia bacterium]|nr:hypothetical protein [Clostridia bacterium]